jgi:hypothetical protein
MQRATPGFRFQATEAAAFSHSSIHSLANNGEGIHVLLTKSSTLNELMMMLPSHPNTTEYSTYSHNGQF